MDFLKYWDSLLDEWIVAKSMRYWDGDKWDKKHALRRWTGSAWYPVETRQPAVLTGDSFTTQALWHFDEMTGDAIEDASPNNITLNRKLYAQYPPWNWGYYYGGLYFNPHRLRASHASAFKFLNSDKYQIDVIFKFTGSAPILNRVFCGNRSAAGDFWVGTELVTGKLVFMLEDTTDTNDWVVGVTNVYDGAWHKATFMWDDGKIRIYLDGNLEGSKTSFLTGNFNVCTYLDIGWIETPPEDWDIYALEKCYIDEIRILKGNILVYGGIEGETPPPEYVWTEITGGKLYQAGESAFFMLEFGGQLYIASENTGKIFRFNGTNWDIVFDTDDLGYGAWINSYHLGVYGGYLYVGFRDYSGSPTSVRIFRSNSGNRYSWGCVHYEVNYMGCTHINFNSAFYTLVNTSVSTKIYRKTNGASANIGSYIKTYAAGLFGDPALFNGKVYWGGFGIYSMDTSHNIVRVYDNGTRHVLSLCEHDGYLYAIDIYKWRATSGNGRLLRSNNGTIWNIVKYLPEPEGWTLESYDGELYVGTRKEGGHGKIYRVNTTTFALTTVGTTVDSGFFSLRTFGTKLFAGTYGTPRSYTLAPT